MNKNRQNLNLNSKLNTLQGSGNEQEEFATRHIGPSAAEQEHMLKALGESSLDGLVQSVIPSAIMLEESRFPKLSADPAQSEMAALRELKSIMDQNELWRSYMGLGYYGTITPPVIQRNFFENPGWYTAYTPYQAEISQGRLESLINFQTMVCELTEMDIANASLLDEATAVGEAMTLMMRMPRNKTAKRFFVSEDVFPQTQAVLSTRAQPLGIELVVGSMREAAEIVRRDGGGLEFFGAVLSLQGADGSLLDLREEIKILHEAGLHVAVTADLLQAMLVASPGEMGADIVCGSAQRFGVPLGFGGPHAGFMAVRDAFKRQLPGRIIGLSKDAAGNPAYRMALQTREQHIRKDKATSNICTAQALLANMAAMYAVYHGADGLRVIAERVHGHTQTLASAVRSIFAEKTPAVGALINETFFDTLTIALSKDTWEALVASACRRKINLRYGELAALGERTREKFSSKDGAAYPFFAAISLDETVETTDVRDLVACLREAVTGEKDGAGVASKSLPANDAGGISPQVQRSTPALKHAIFHSIHSETQMLRYLSRLEKRDLSLNHSMIPLGSCTMKLNAVTEMLPLSWPSVGGLHPLTPAEQVPGYMFVMEKLTAQLAEISGFAGVSLQPNSGAQGEYAGLMTIRAYHESNNEHARRVVLIPVSAHGTNPASAVMAGMQPMLIPCLENGDIDEGVLREKCESVKDVLAGLMITYPSTHGVFEENILSIIECVHEHGGQVYMDGANMNAQTGWTSPGHMGADVCHFNLHKTFAIPHGGGGPGMGPIGVAKHLLPFLPATPFSTLTHADKANMVFQTMETQKEQKESFTGAVSAAPFGSASILMISYLYIKMLSYQGLRASTAVAILNANYLKKRLEEAYPILYTGKGNSGTGKWVAHEMIVDVRMFKETANILPEDIAKRLIDYGFHAPTMSWPVVGTLMIEPTESEDLGELDRFAEAMLMIRREIAAIESGDVPRENNVLKNAPHTAKQMAAAEWNFPYSREQAVFPLPWVGEAKYWPPVARIDNVYGDRNLFCTCPPLEAYVSVPETAAAIK